MNVALYARVSSDSQDVDLSISAQLKAIRDYALKHSYEATREFKDEAQSGRTADRPAFREMIALAKTKIPPFEAILVWKLNRFARSRADSITYKTLLRKKKIEVISINEPVDNSPGGQLLEGMIECVDEFYSANLGQDIKRGMRENASRGFYNGSRPSYRMLIIEVPDGPKMRHTLALKPKDSTEIRIIRRIFDMASHDTGCKEIANILNHEGFRTTMGERWGRCTVHKILNNEAYCGTLVWGGRPGHPALRSDEAPVRVENAWQSIIEPDIFGQIQRKMASKNPRLMHPKTVPSTYLLSGMAHYCSCGSAMMGHSAKSGHNHYYLCSRKYRQGNEACSSRSIPKDVLEHLIIDEVRSKILNEANIQKLAELINQELKSSSQGLRGNLEAIDKESKEIGVRLSRLYDAIETAKVSLEDLAPRIKELRER
jgi:site-specific DNA recombinase